MGYGGDKSGGYKGGSGFGGGFGGGGYKGDGGSKGGGVSLYPNDGGYKGSAGGGGGYKGGVGKKGGYFGNNRKGGGKGKNPFGMSYGGGKFDGGGKDSGKSKGGKDGGKSSNPLVGSREIRTLAHQNCNVLQRITAPLPQNLRHWDSVDCLAMMDGKILAGSRDKHMSMWNGEAQSDGRLFLKQFNCTPFHTGITYLLVEASTNWLFVGLFSGQIKAFQQKPEMELVLKGHERAISYLYVYDKFLLSVSRDETFKVWEFSDQSRTFVNNFSAKSPVGELNCLRTIGSDLSNTKIWLGGEKGIACINMQQLVCEGNIPTDAGVVGPFFVYQNDHVVCALKNGSIKCYSTQGALVHEVSASRSTKRVHCSEMMLGPNDTIVFLLGGDFGWITAYSVPELDVIGEFCVNKAEPSRVKSIADCGTGDMFVVGLENGEIYVYKWGNGLGSNPQEQEQQNMANLFAPTGGPVGVGVAAAPGLAMGGGLGGIAGGGMAGGAPQVNPFTGQAIAGGAAGPGMLGGGQMGMGGNDTMMM